MSTAESILGDLEQDVNRAATQWAIFAETALQAYDTAYGRQQQLLGAIKQKIADREQSENDRMAFALTILTVGILGPVADDIAATFQGLKHAKKYQAAIGQLAEKSGEAIAGQITDLAKAPTAGDAFAPVGRSPTYIGSKLRETFLRWKLAMSGLAAGLKSASIAISADAASRVRMTLKQSPFFTDIPSGVTEGVLVPAAELALWIGWLRDRDANWWSKNTHEFNAQVFDFLPLRDRLAALGIPAQLITFTAPLATIRPGTVVMSMQQGLHMHNAITWSKSIDAVIAMLKHVKKHRDGLTMALTLNNSKAH